MESNIAGAVVNLIILVLMQDIPSGIQITRVYLFLLILQSDPTLCFKNTFFGYYFQLIRAIIRP
jgi:hypothetical protein